MSMCDEKRADRKWWGENIFEALRRLGNRPFDLREAEANMREVEAEKKSVPGKASSP